MTVCSICSVLQKPDKGQLLCVRICVCVCVCVCVCLCVCVCVCLCVCVCVNTNAAFCPNPTVTSEPVQVIRKGEVSCCWICTTCKDNEIVQDEFTCRACELGWWPDDDLQCRHPPVSCLGTHLSIHPSIRPSVRQPSISLSFHAPVEDLIENGKCEEDDKFLPFERSFNSAVIQPSDHQAIHQSVLPLSLWMILIENVTKSETMALCLTVRLPNHPSIVLPLSLLMSSKRI